MPEQKEMKHASDKMIDELANDYAAYIKTKKVHETVEDMMIRLEEFESIVGMVQNLRAECAYEHLVKFRSIHPQLLDLCRRIDALEHVVARACIDLTNLETAVETAENELGKCSTVSDRLFGILNPLSLFKSRNSEVSIASSSGLTSSPRRMPHRIDLPPIYRTEDAFKTMQ
ncbi:hypothetical protein PV325_006790 [Microctonus aethiopoides]|nr:hypothetical protein PV325_006790 [Microctonus aethiopoides]KAK0097598.1 hypothetical protein PV326_000828 [Microctonus aethiopoides]